MSKTLEITPQSQNWALKMFYMIIHDHFKGKAEYWNLQYLPKISPKNAFYIPGSIKLLQYIFLQWKYATWGQGMTKN